MAYDKYLQRRLRYGGNEAALAAASELGAITPELSTAMDFWESSTSVSWTQGQTKDLLASTWSDSGMPDGPLYTTLNTGASEGSPQFTVTRTGLYVLQLGVDGATTPLAVQVNQHRGAEQVLHPADLDTYYSSVVVALREDDTFRVSVSSFEGAVTSTYQELTIRPLLLIG